MADKRRGVLIKMPPALKRAVVQEADRRGESVNDVVVAAISAHFGIPFEPTGRRSRRADSRNLDVMLRLSDDLKWRIQLDALHRRTNMTHLLVELLAGRFGVDLAYKRPHRQTPFGGGRQRDRA